MAERDFVLSTETTCDMPMSYYAQQGVNLLGLTFTIDGASFVQVFTRINMPLAKNGLVSAGVLMLLANQTRPYEKNPGETDAHVDRWVQEICGQFLQEGQQLLHDAFQRQGHHHGGPHRQQQRRLRTAPLHHQGQQRPHHAQPRHLDDLLHVRSRTGT